MKPKLEIRLSWLIIAAVLWFLIFSLAGKAFAGGLLDPEWLNDWDTVDRLLLGGYSAAWFLDWGQTRTIATDDRWNEGNSFLGYTPTKSTVNVYFIGFYTLNLFVSNTLGDVPGWLGVDWGSVFRKAYLLGFMYEHARCVKKGVDLGIAINFNIFKF